MTEAAETAKFEQHRDAPARFTPAGLAARIVLAVGGGYGASSAVVAGLTVMLTWLGLARTEAVVAASMPGFVLYLGLLIWGFADRSLLRFSGGLAVLSGLGLLAVLALPSAGR